MIKSAREMRDEAAEERLTIILEKYFTPAYKFFSSVRT